MDSQKRSYDILALVLAVGGAAVGAGVVGFYLLKPDSLRSTSLTNIMAGLGALSALYYGSLHQFIKRRFLGMSTAILVAFSLINLILLISQTGGLDSPFYSLWLLVIVVSGLFGGIYTILALGATTLYYLVSAISHSFSSTFLSNHLIQFVVTLAAAGVAEWVYSRGRRSSVHQQHAASLSSQLSQEQLKAEVLMGSMADGVIVVDNALKLQLLNPAAQLLTGWDLASAQNVHYRSVLHLKSATDQDISDTDDPFIEAWNNGKPLIKNNLLTVTKAGRKIELSLSISPIYTDDHQISGGIAVFHDISGDKAIERQRGEFISTASHEMRTPVAAIEGYISLAMNAKVATIDDRARSFLEKAHENVQHLGALFRDLLSITKLEEGKVGKKLEIVDLGKLLKDIVADMQFSVTQKGLTLTYTPTSMDTTHAITPYYPVMAEPERLREVVMNLIENAAKFTAHGGITVRISGDAANVIVGVTDTGIGIAAEDIPHLFQKFYRIDNSATRTIGGTGLGLYLCRGLIELYNGRLWVESLVGQGSTFKFSLPLAKTTNNLSPLPAAPTPIPIPVAAAPATVVSTISNPFPLAKRPVGPTDIMAQPLLASQAAAIEPVAAAATGSITVPVLNLSSVPDSGVNSSSPIPIAPVTDTLTPAGTSATPTAIAVETAGIK